MDFISMSSLVTLLFLLLLVDYSLNLHASEFQCLTCDNRVDGPACGEFTREIPLRTCRTFCYFAILLNRSAPASPSLASLRAIRDCSPSDDLSIEGYQLLESKIGTSHSSPSTIEILSLKRCNSEQCNNEFYLNPEDLFANHSSLTSLPAGVLFFVMIFYSLKKHVLNKSTRSFSLRRHDALIGRSPSESPRTRRRI